MKRKLILIFIVLLLIACLGVSRAYFVAKSNTSGDGGNVTTITAVTPYLSYSTSKMLNIEASLDNFSMNNDNLSDKTELYVTLNKGTLDIAKENYNIYLEIETNGFIYSTTKRDPEVLLKIVDPTGKIVTEIDGLDYVTINGDSGFDITEKQNFIALNKNYYIETTSESTQKWDIELMFVNLDEVQNKNAGKEFSAKLVVDTKERKEKKYTVYSWSGVSLLPSNIENTVNVLNSLDIGAIYHSFPTESFYNGEAARIISKLKANDIDSYWLVGAATWIDRLDILKSDVDILALYNSNNPESKIKGIVFDIEWNLNGLNIENIEKYANLMQEIYNYAKKKGIQIVDCISWAYDLLFDEKYENSAQFTKEERERASKAFEKIILNADRTSVMNYQRYGMVDRIRNEILVGKKYNKEIETIGEFGRYTSDNRTTTLECHKELPKDCPLEPIELAKKLWKEIYDTYPYEKLSYSFHYLDLLLYVVGEYDRIAFKTTLNGEVIDNDLMYAVFDSEGNIPINTKSDVHLPKNSNYKLFSPNYKIKSETLEALEDGTKLFTVDVELADKYAFEMYPYIYDESTDKYVGVKNGTIEVKNLATGFNYIREVNNKGYTSIYRALFVDSEYLVTYIDENGVKYKIDSVMSMKQELLNGNGNLVIPDDFRKECKENSNYCYLAASLNFSK